MKVQIKGRAQAGFTIVELLIVIVVIGVLAAISIVSYNGIQASARDKSILSDLSAVEAEITRYAVKHDGVYGTAVQWFSGGTANANIDFSPSAGNIIDVVASDTAYCIRGHNPSANKNSISNAYEKASSDTACAALPPSPDASL